MLDLMFSGHQQSEDFEISGRLRPAHFRNSLFPVHGEIPQQRANHRLAQLVTRATKSETKKSPLPGGRQNEVGLAARAAASWRAPASCIAIAMRSMQPLSLYCAKNVYKPNSLQPAGKVYPHEIDIQETHSNHRKLDS